MKYVAFAIAEKCALGQDCVWMSGIYNNVGNSLLCENQYSIALEWYEKAITTAVEGSNSSQQAKWLQNKGHCYRSLKQSSYA